MLLLLPLRSLALRAAARLAALAQSETRADSIQGKQRLFEEFGAPSDDEDEAPGGGRGGRGGAAGGKPAEHAALFAGNSDDHFRFGIKFTRCAETVRASNQAGLPDTAHFSCVGSVGGRGGRQACRSCSALCKQLE